MNALPSLAEIVKSHFGKITDKWSSYIIEYNRLFQPYRDQTISLLEIGVQNGGSLEVWSQYFHHARVLVGCDIDEACRGLTYADNRVNVVVGNAVTAEIQVQILDISPSYDLIIDDGSHTSSDIVKSFAFYFGALAEGGLYIVEDLHCSYWQDYEGGLNNTSSSIHFFKLLCDIVNHQSWGLSLSRQDLLKDFSGRYGVIFSEEQLAEIHSLEFFNSVCVVRKAAAKSNILGVRVVQGQEALVNVAPLKVNGQELVAPPQSPHASHPARSVPVFFDEAFYLSTYPDVAVAGVNALQHYLFSGRAEGRFPTAEMAVLAAVQEARSWTAEQSVLFSGAWEEVKAQLHRLNAKVEGCLGQSVEWTTLFSEQLSQLAGAIGAGQQQLEQGQRQHAAQLEEMARKGCEFEERQQRLQHSLRVELTADLTDLVATQGAALAASLRAVQKRFDGGQEAHAAQLAALVLAQGAQEERQQQLQHNLQVELTTGLTDLVTTQGAALAASLRAAQNKFERGQEAHAAQLAALVDVQARQEERARRKDESLHRDLSAFRGELAQMSAAYLDAKQTYEAHVAALESDLETEKTRLAWRAANPFSALWRDLMARKQ